MKKNIFKLLVTLGTPLTFLAALWLKFVLKSKQGGEVEDTIFSKLGILPILDQYYEPLINPKKHLRKSLREDRLLPSIDFNIREQLNILSEFHYNDELVKFSVDKGNDDNEINYYYNNGSYCTGDGEYLYNMIRHFKPGKIIEIGSGFSTLMAKSAVDKNKCENKNYQCEHICIEPYEMPWLESKNVTVIRKKVEDINISFFEQLQANDILFIDSSHIIRPQGDVLYEYLEVLPILNPGVIVHVHDIFMPKDYLDEWIYKRHYLWNEQYLLEAFLSFNDRDFFSLLSIATLLQLHIFYNKLFYAKKIRMI